jgi:hypothetical protein
MTMKVGSKTVLSVTASGDNLSIEWLNETWKNWGELLQDEDWKFLVAATNEKFAARKAKGKGNGKGK